MKLTVCCLTNWATLDEPSRHLSTPDPSVLLPCLLAKLTNLSALNWNSWRRNSKTPRRSWRKYLSCLNHWKRNLTIRKRKMLKNFVLCWKPWKTTRLSIIRIFRTLKSISSSSKTTKQPWKVSKWTNSTKSSRTISRLPSTNYPKVSVEPSPKPNSNSSSSKE